jgi:hypothetical protein
MNYEFSISMERTTKRLMQGPSATFLVWFSDDISWFVHHVPSFLHYLRLFLFFPCVIMLSRWMSGFKYDGKHTF